MLRRYATALRIVRSDLAGSSALSPKVVRWAQHPWGSGCIRTPRRIMKNLRGFPERFVSSTTAEARQSPTYAKQSLEQSSPGHELTERLLFSKRSSKWSHRASPRRNRPDKQNRCQSFYRRDVEYPKSQLLHNRRGSAKLNCRSQSISEDGPPN